MNKNLCSFFLISIFILSNSNVLGQANLLNARVPQDVGQLNEKQVKANDEEPLAYGFIDDRDVLWSKTIWELIDLNERLNFPLYYPEEPGNLGEERKSLFDVIMTGIKDGEIKEIYTNDGGYFKQKMTYAEILQSTSRKFYLDEYNNLVNQGVTDPEVLKPYIAEPELKSQDVLQYRIKGTWYFDKRQGEMKYRLLGIAPCARDIETKDPNKVDDYTQEEKDETYPLFWVWYPDARDVLNKANVFNTRNSSQPITFDHILNSRRFNATIYKEENVYQDREITNYIQKDALQQLLESERIKNVIRDFEQDMWNN